MSKENTRIGIREIMQMCEANRRSRIREDVQVNSALPEADMVQYEIRKTLRRAFSSGENAIVLTEKELTALSTYCWELKGYYEAELREFSTDRQRALEDLLEALAEARGLDAAAELLTSTCAMLGDGRLPDGTPVGEGLAPGEARERLLAMIRKRMDAENVDDWQTQDGLLEGADMGRMCMRGVWYYEGAVRKQQKPGDMDGLLASSFFLGMLMELDVNAAMGTLPCVVALLCAAAYAVGSVDRQEKLGRHFVAGLEGQAAREADAIRRQLRGGAAERDDAWQEQESGAVAVQRQARSDRTRNRR